MRLSFCLDGPAGTGKSAWARHLARRLGLPIIERRASDLLSMWVGGTEQASARAFADARAEGALLIFDEADSLLADRRNAVRQWEVSQVNEFLTQLENFDGLFIASTNLADNLDQAALRRFDLKVKFDFLKPVQACELLRRHCAQLLQCPRPLRRLDADRDDAIGIAWQRWLGRRDLRAVEHPLSRGRTTNGLAYRATGLRSTKGLHRAPPFAERRRTARSAVVFAKRGLQRSGASSLRTPS